MNRAAKWLAGAMVLAAMAGCQGGGKGATTGGMRSPVQTPPPPPAPPVRDMPLDANLAASARAELEKAAGSDDPFVRANAIDAIGEVLGADGQRWIVAALDDPNPVVRFHACMEAGLDRLAGVHDKLLTMAEDVSPSVRVGVRFALHRLGDTHLSHDLEKSANDPNENVRFNTALALGRLGEPSAVVLLEPMQRDPSPTVRMQVAQALWLLGNTEGLTTLVEFSISEHPDDQMVAMVGLAEPRDPRVITHVRGMLVSDYQEVSLSAARAMGMLGSDEGYRVAESGARSADPRLRVLGALALGAIGRADTQPLLAPLLKDADPTVRVAAAMAILQLRK